MKKTLITALVFAVIVGCAPKEHRRVVATLPAIESICRDLTAGTDIEVVNPFPRDISIAEFEQYRKEHQSALDSLAGVDAVFDLRSIIPEDAAFLDLRKRNIHIVEVDCASPLDENISGLPLITDSSGTNRHVWLSISNAMKMAEIAGKDLVSLYPSDSVQIRKNLSALKSGFFDLKNRYELLFSVIERFDAAPMTTDFDYLLKDINLFVPLRLSPDETSWTPEEFSRIRGLAADGQLRTIINRWKPSGPAGGLCDSLGIKTAVLVTGDPAMDAYKCGLKGLIETNLSSLLSALSR